jgi:hypothetical protein
MSKVESTSTPPTVAEVTVAVRDPVVHEIVLALIRLNRMQGRSLGVPDPRGASPPSAAADSSILVGYISSTADYEYFDLAMRQTGHPPFVALVPHDIDPQLLDAVEKKVTKVIRLPENAGAIADSIRGQWAPPPIVRKDPSGHIETAGATA